MHSALPAEQRIVSFPVSAANSVCLFQNQLSLCYVVIAEENLLHLSFSVRDAGHQENKEEKV